MVVLHILLPIFAVIATGFMAVRTGYLDRNSVAPAGQIVIRIALPALIFLALATTPATEAFDLRFLLVYGAASLGVMGLCFGLARFALHMTQAEAAVVALGVSMANSGFLGFPIGQALLGPEAAIRIFTHCLIVENILILPLGLLILSATSADGASISRATLARDMLRNPLMLALIAGGAVSLLGLGVPPAAHSVLELLARLSAPLALLVIGGMLASLPASGRIGAVGLIVGGKLVLHPLAVGLGAALMPGLSSQMAAGGILFAAMPMITIFPLLAARAGQGQLAAFGLLVATLGSFASLPLVIHLLGLAQL
ncbi:MAG: AEC family transporter [Roseinatronobacter sp.]|nr:AEC family transporter [Roseinatronobacter sp.]